MFQFDPPQLDVYALAPVVLVALTGLVALIIEIFSPKRNNNLIVAVSLAGLGLSLFALVMSFGKESYDFAAGTLVRDSFGSALQGILILGTAFVVLFSEPYLRERRIPFAEFYPLILWSTAGGMLMVGTRHLLLVFLGLEILSIAIYVMAGMNRGEARSGESALKYFLLGSFASAFLLYGIALVYGATGSLSLERVPLAWVQGGPLQHTLLLVGLALMLVGLSFKSSFAPFHQWTPDVYQGAPTNVTAFMATGSKVAALGALYRVLEAYTPAFDAWATIVAGLAILTMVVGNVAALTQRDVKRMLGYSSVAQAGYVLVAILAHAKYPREVGPQTVVFFLLSYVLTTLGAFAVVALNTREDETTTLQDLHGLARRSPLAAGGLAFFALSLIGMPPLSGFFAKLYVLADALKTGMPSLAIVLALTSAISAIYYLRLARAPFVDAETQTLTFAPATRVAVVLCGIGVLAIALFASPLFSAVGLEANSPRPIAQR